MPSRKLKLARDFLVLIKHRPHMETTVAYCAAQLGISTGYLNRICKDSFLKCTYCMIQEEIILEAQNQIREGDRGQYKIHFDIGFNVLADENCFNINKLVNYCIDNQSVGNQIRTECVITKPGSAFHRLVATFVQAGASFKTISQGGFLNFQEHPTIFYYGRVFTFFPDNPGDILVDEM